MKKYLVSGSIIALVIPGLALATYTDVSLTTDTVLSVNGITLNVSGSPATIESIIVNATNFTVGLPAGSNIQVTAPGREKLSVSDPHGITSETCNSSQSLVGYAPTESITITITPSSTLCTSDAAGGGGGASAPSSGGGGGTVSTVATTPVAVTTPAVVTPAVTTPSVSATGLSSSQIQSILDVLASFDADASIIAKVKASLEGTVKAGSVTSSAVSAFKSDLDIGALGADVKALQQYLNAHGAPVASSGAGSPGSETTKFGSLTKAALAKFQKANGITPSAGYFGPKTRAYIEAHP